MPELLAPAGNPTSLKAAVYGGCDAVYLGLDIFNARAKADNFTRENIKEYIDFCHLYGVKVYIAFNTSVKNNELPLLREYAVAAEQAGADAFIVTDLGTLSVFKDLGVPLHASTQMGIHNVYGAKAAKQLGFSRVVLSRECTVEDIREIKQTGIEVEVFVHGALCVSFSGGCLMSSFMSGDSGNRGRCNQPCRMKYGCEGKSGYFLSAADLCMLDRIQELSEAGADSLKIEGRLKTPYYVAETVSAYRAVLDGSGDGKERSRLLRAFNRGGFTSGYGSGPDKRAVMSPYIQNNMGEHAGKTVAVGRGYIDVRACTDINVGDGLKIVRDNCEKGGFTVDKIQHIQGKIIRISCDSRMYSAGDEVRITYDAARAAVLQERKKHIGCRFFMTARAGEKARLRAVSDGVECIVESEQPLTVATSAPADEAQIKEVLEKGAGEFECSALAVETDGKTFLPKSILNAMRKDAINKLKSAILNKYNETKLVRSTLNIRTLPDAAYLRDNGKGRKYVISDDLSLCDPVIERGCEYILSISDYLQENIRKITQSPCFLQENKKVILLVPTILRRGDLKIFTDFLRKYNDRFYALYCNNIGAVEIAKEFKMKAIGGTGLNIYNSETLRYLDLYDYVASCELTAAELEKMPYPVIYAYGRVPLMTLTHCPVQLIRGGSCSDCRYSGDMEYSDRFGNYRIDRVRISSCYFILRNPVVTDISLKFNTRAQNNGKYLLDMVKYDRATALSVTDAYLSGERGVSGSNSGHLFRGVK